MIETIYPLSPLQEGILFHSLYQPEPGLYFVQKSWRMLGRLEVAALQQAWQQTVDRHPILRTAFVWKGREKPLQIVARQICVPWEQEDWRALSDQEQHTRLTHLLEADRARGFDLARPPLLRLILVRLADDCFEFIWSHHHVLLDGWSAVLVLNEVYAFYEALTQGRQLTLKAPRPYQDYIGWLRRQDRDRANTFWTEYLKGFTRPTAVPAQKLSRSASSETPPEPLPQLSLSRARTSALRALVRQHRITLSTILQGAWALLLGHYNQTPEVLFGLVVSGRPAELTGVESMIGLFINTLPRRILIKAQSRLTDWLKSIQADQLELRPFEFSALSDIQRCSDLPPGAPLFESIVVFENYPGVGRATAEPQPRYKLEGTAFVKNNYPLTLRALPGPEFSVQMLYDRSRFDETTIQHLLEDIETQLQLFLESPEVTVAQILDSFTGREARRKTVLGEQLAAAGRAKLKSSRRRSVSL